MPAGTHLFRIGDPDDSIFVIQSGKVTVYIKDVVCVTFGLLYTLSYSSHC